MLKRTILIIFLIFLGVAVCNYKTTIRLYEGFQLNQLFKDTPKYYILKNNVQIQDITQKVILDKSVPYDLKKSLISAKRRIVIFKYLSGSNYVAGYYNYIAHGDHPTIIFLRGGNGFFGIMRPNNKFSFIHGVNVVGTLYRGNIYGGKDDFGGKDIKDIEALLQYFPELERFTHTKFSTPYGMMGVSRGAMEMFDVLSRSDYVQNRVDHAISVSGNLDLRTSMSQRPEMRYLFETQYKNSAAKSFEEWLRLRNPIDNAQHLSKSLKVLLLYGLSDNRVSLEEQQNFKQALEGNGIFSELITIPDGNHGLTNNFQILENEVVKFMNRKRFFKADHYFSRRSWSIE